MRTGGQEISGKLERCNRLLTLHGWKVVEKLIECVSGGQVIQEILHRHPRAPQPAPALTAPGVAGDTDGDGLLTMEEILALRLNADWAVPSACNTASGEGAGSEAISGLGRAFFYAGARALLVSSWPVETTSAKALTTDLFRRQSAEPGLGRAEALRQTMNALIDGPGYVDPGTNRVVFSYAHPIFWAPFALVGDGGRRGEVATGRSLPVNGQQTTSSWQGAASVP